MTEISTPISCGFSMPAEWELHEATWLTWPHNEETWIGYSLDQVEAVYLEMIAALVTGESVHLLVNDEAMREKVAQRLTAKQIDLEKIKFYQIPTNDSWIRDYGPLFLSRETETGGTETAAALWQFNAWGNKYDYPLDAKAGKVLVDSLRMRTFEPDFVLEGGSIEVNGQGTLITTRQCLLDPKRNEGVDQDLIEQRLKDYLGVKHIIWCDGQMEGDDTDGHIDNLVRFTDSHTVLALDEGDTQDPNYHSLKKNMETLKQATDQNGKELNVIPMPTPEVVLEGVDRLPASYANYYIGNNVILLPVFDHSNDKEAENILSRLFSDREVVRINGKVLVSGLGGPHCLTQQQPIQFDF
jgi:agmatine deiminase